MDQQRIDAIQREIAENLSILNKRFEKYTPTDENSDVPALKQDYHFLNISVEYLYQNLAMYGEIIRTAYAEYRDRIELSEQEMEIVNGRLIEIRKRFMQDIDTTNIKINNLNAMIEQVEKRLGI